MNEPELNEKLAEWAGFTVAGLPAGGICFEYPDHTYKKTMPNFTQSLDACFKWLVPKLLDMKIKVRLSVNTSVVTHRSPQASLVSMDGGCNKQNRLHICANAEILALALCFAVEKLIDRSKKNE